MLSQLKKIVGNADQKELLKGSSEVIAIKVAGLMVGYGFVMILARNYGAEAVGVYQIAVQFVGLFAAITLIGFNQSIIRYSSELLAQKKARALRALVGKFSTITLVLSATASAIAYWNSAYIAEWFLKDAELANIVKLASFMIPLLALTSLYVELIRGFRRVKLSEFFRTLSIRLLGLVVFIAAIAFVPFTSILPVITYGVALTCTFVGALVAAIWLLRRNSRVEPSQVESVSDEKYIKVSLTMWQSILMMMLSNQVLVFVLAYFTEPASVGIYNVAMQIANLSNFVFGAVVTISAPKYSQAFYSDRDRFADIVRFSSKLVFWSSGTIALLTILGSWFIMSLFGSEFQAGALVLVMLSLGNFVNAVTGPSGALLDMIGRHSVRRNILFLNTGLTLSLSVVLVPRYGAIGLASVILISKIFGNLAGAIYVKKKVGVDLIYFPFLTKD